MGLGLDVARSQASTSPGFWDASGRASALLGAGRGGKAQHGELTRRGTGAGSQTHGGAQACRTISPGRRRVMPAGWVNDERSAPAWGGPLRERYRDPGHIPGISMTYAKAFSAGGRLGRWKPRDEGQAAGAPGPGHRAGAPATPARASGGRCGPRGCGCRSRALAGPGAGRPVPGPRAPVRRSGAGRHHQPVPVPPLDPVHQAAAPAVLGVVDQQVGRWQGPFRPGRLGARQQVPGPCHDGSSLPLEAPGPSCSIAAPLRG